MISALKVTQGRMQRFEIASQADRCVAWLRASGLTVLSIGAGPCITIRPSPLCDKFEGVVEGYYRTAKGETRYRMVSRFDCAVRWAVAETAGPKKPAVSLLQRLMAWGEAVAPWGWTA